MLGNSFAAQGEWLVPGTVSLDWDDMEAASGFELMWRGEQGWALLSQRDLVEGAAVELDGSSALVGGLPEHLGEYWFSVRARSVYGVSQWSPSFQVTVPPTAVKPQDAEPLFDPFTAPTRSNIDLERLGEAAATITPGQADCDAASALDVTGITIVDPPADLDDPDAELTVAEVVRIAGGCLLVEYADLAGRTVSQVRDLLASEPTVFAVDEPVRGLVPDHDTSDPAYTHPAPPKNMPDQIDQTGHHKDGGGWQWHLTPDVVGLWQQWIPTSPVTVAVLDELVDAAHPDLGGRIPVGLGGCHASSDVAKEGHGTYVAGIIAAEAGNGVGVAGVAPDARILPVKMISEEVCLTMTAAVNNGARVINMSFSWNRDEREEVDVGGVQVDSGDEDSFEAALRTASMLGVVPVTSVGNCGDDRDLTENGDEVNEHTQEEVKKGWEWMQQCPEHNAVNSPSVYDDVISVAAVKHGGYRLEMSSADALVDIAAPGEFILSTQRCIAPNSCGTEARSGTSAAAPFVSGVVAHMLNRYPQATPGQVREALEKSARHIDQPSPLDSERWTPRGRAGDPKAGPPSREFGHGIVNPVGAVEKLGEIIDRQSVREPVGGFVSVVAGGLFSCGVSGNGAARCWGDQDLFDAVPTRQEFSQVSAPVGNLGYGCGLRPLGPGDVRGTVLCWTGTSTSSRVLEFAPQGAFVQLAAGRVQTCGLRPFKPGSSGGSDGPGGGVVCWVNMTGERVSGVPSGRFAKLSGGGDHWCGLRTNATAVCWGANTYGQLDLPAGLLFEEISAGGKHTCGVTYLTGVLCWGDADAIAGVPTTLGFQSIDAGFEHTCAVQNRSEVKSPDSEGVKAVCWGDNSHGQASPPNRIFAEVSAGWRHSCGVVQAGRVASGEVVCWGDDSFGQAPGGRLAGLSLTDAGGSELVGFDPEVTEYAVVADPGVATLSFTVGDGANSEPKAVASLADSDPATLGHQVVLADGVVIEVAVTSLFGFGVSRTYRIEVVSPPRLGSLSVRPVGSGPSCVPACSLLDLDPVFDAAAAGYRVVVQPGVSQVTVGFSARVLADPVSASPLDADGVLAGHQVALTTNTGFAQMDAGNNHTCGVATGGAARCWGSDGFGRSSVPAGAYASVSAGWGHSCAVDTASAAVCWGDDYWGQSQAPSGAFASVSAGWGHSCGLTTAGAARCWGYNFSGQSRPPSGTFRAVAAGGNHSCGITDAGALRCWGLNRNGQASPPSGTFTALAAGWQHNCAIKSDATVACWGNSGSGRTAAPSGTFTAVSAGQEHSCGVNTDGAAVCWGNNGSGQATALSGLFTVASAGEGHSCGLTDTGTVLCWGTGSATQPATSATVTITVASAPDNTTVYTIAIGRTAAQSTARSAQARSESGRALIDERLQSLARGPRTGSAQCPATAPDAEIQLPDPVLRAGVEQALGKPTGAPITAAELATLTALSLSPSPDSATVTDLSGFQHATALEALDIADNDIADLAPLGCLTNLTTLNAARNDVSDLAPLRNLTSLERLYLYDNQISDLAPLSALTALTSLDVGFNQIADIASLRAMASLESLGLGGNQIADLAPLTALTGLDALYVFDNEIADPGPLSGLSSLDVLWVDGNRITGTATLAGLSALGYLDVRFNEIADTSPLDALAGTIHTHPQSDTPAEIPDPSLRAAVQAALGLGSSQAPTIGHLATLETLERVGSQNDPAPIRSLEGLQHAVNLETLTLRNNQIADIAPLAGLTGLQRLSLQVNEVADITPLANLTELTTLNLGGNRIADITPLAGLTELSWLMMSANQIADVAALGGLDELYFLRLSGNRISDVTALAGLDSIHNLQLFGNQITDLAPLSGLDTLRYLDLRQNQIANLAPLSGLTGLWYLYLSYNQITDIAPIGGLTGLTHLFLTDNQIADIAPLATLTGLQHLYLRNNPATDLAPLNGLTELTIHQ